MLHQTLSHSERCLEKTRGCVSLESDTLESDNSVARKATLLKQLLFTKMRDGENMMDHLNNFFGTVDKLKEIEIMVAEDLLAIL